MRRKKEKEKKKESHNKQRKILTLNHIEHVVSKTESNIWRGQSFLYMKNYGADSVQHQMFVILFSNCGSQRNSYYTLFLCVLTQSRQYNSKKASETYSRTGHQSFFFFLSFFLVFQ